MPRRVTPEVIEIELPPKPRRWPLVLAALIAVLALAGWLFGARLFPSAPLVPKAQVDAVTSEVAQHGDSLDVVVAWVLGKGPLAGLVDSVRIEVDVASSDSSRVTMSPASRGVDTLRFGVTPLGQATGGTSCVATLSLGRLSHERCTPWQFVRPSATAVAPDSALANTSPRKSGGHDPAAGGAPRIARIVIHPEGQQVDPDLGGRCARWQQQHPGQSVWIEVNRTAVPDCTGPNGKPTVAQFCAFAVLKDGRRIKTANSARNPYCEAVFEEWARERVS
ncbi:MAG TPA: hypothetical protein VHR41_08955 [Gemmatimonadales bacterium]|jgi:hypothetical protein|nr:hypothetical protein [Gemmatimonadales bacterium]